jgi:uncharacterized GH25 family protein
MMKNRKRKGKNRGIAGDNMEILPLKNTTALKEGESFPYPGKDESD